uniref:Transposase domain-containing protein n=1 Tax=Megaselia scalaris TaxID=36166 RepID=T1GXB5_MEGSC
MEEIGDLTRRTGLSRRTLKRKSEDVRNKCQAYFQSSEVKKKKPSSTDNGIYEIQEISVQQDHKSEESFNDNIVKIPEEVLSLTTEDDHSIFEDSSQEENNCERNIYDDLLLWSLECNIRNSSLTKLLKILRSHGHNLPQDARTLKKTPRTVPVKDVDPGVYWHFGIKAMIDLLLENDVHVPSSITVDINLDGLPIYDSSSSVFWPIQGQIQELKAMKPFVIGIYFHIKSKPKCMHQFLGSLVDEMIEFENAQALAMVKMIQQHNGKHGCPNCHIIGRHDGPSEIGPLEKLNIDMVRSFPTEYLHVVCLGVVKKKLRMIMSNLRFPKSNRQREMFERTSFMNINKVTSLSQPSKPLEIHRAIRHFTEYLSDFKGTDFILYYGIVVLKDNVHPKIYQNFVDLHCALTICMTDEYSHFIPFADAVFKKFVEDYKIIYGSCMVSYNVHQLLHITDAVKYFGNLNKYSAYPFESKLGVIKNYLSSGNFPLEQAAKRTVEHIILDIVNYKKSLDTGNFVYLININK